MSYSSTSNSIGGASPNWNTPIVPPNMVIIDGRTYMHFPNAIPQQWNQNKNALVLTQIQRANDPMPFGLRSNDADNFLQHTSMHTEGQVATQATVQVQLRTTTSFNGEHSTIDVAAEVSSTTRVDQEEAMLPKRAGRRGRGKKKGRVPPHKNPTGTPCEECPDTISIQWRLGPNGPATLCNPCGLKYARAIRDAYEGKTPTELKLKQHKLFNVICQPNYRYPQL